jgi:TrpR family trp operon transcriptional repressor
MTIDDPRVNENLSELSQALSKTGDPGLINDLLRCLLTQAEIADIAGRWALVKALREKTSQRVIARELGVSLCKITRGSRELKKANSAFNRIFNV